MAADPYKYFRIEAREILDGLSTGVLALEQPPISEELIARLLRFAHTLKGAARVVRLTAIADRSHLVEEVLEAIREGGAASREQIDRLLTLIDEMAQRVAALKTGDAPPPLPPPSEGTPVPLRSNESAPVLLQHEASELDAVLDGLSQVALELSELKGVAGRLERSSDLLTTLSRQLARAAGFTPQQGRSDPGRELIDALERELGVVREALDSGIVRAERELKQSRQAAEAVRLVPARALFATLGRTARDAAHSTGKRVTFLTEGGDVRLDAEVLAGIQPALIQLVRNAVAHGLESPEARVAAGKPIEGRITLAVERRWGRILLRCTDDGQGIDLAAAKRVAEQRGMVPRDGEGLDANGWIRLLLRGGISTAGAVTQLSGRGVGLDVVSDAMARFSGEVSVDTVRGKGTTFSLKVPISSSALEVLLAELSGVRVALPLQAVRATARVAPEDVVATAEGAALRIGGELFALGTLAPSLGLNLRAGPARPPNAIVLRAGESAVAIGVDRIIGTEVVVVRSVPALAPTSPVVGGLWLDPEGMPQMVIDPVAAIDALQRSAAPEVLAARRGPRLPVLVVDDSLTTRMLEQSILESAGYQVVLAVSAEDGLEKLKGQRFGLILVDVEMPGMDGFAFVEKVRANPALRELPVIMVTSRNAPEDHQRGQDVGANGYMVKSEFDQSSLLATIRRLMGEP